MRCPYARGPRRAVSFHPNDCPLGNPENAEAFLGRRGAPDRARKKAVQKYMNGRKVPQLFVASGASKWNDPKQFPWTMGWQPSYRIEARIFAHYILKTRPDGRVALFYANDDLGKDYVNGLKVRTSATDFAPIEQLRMMQFKNGRWVFFGDTLGAETDD
jgi:hypothetical protein